MEDTNPQPDNKAAIQPQTAAPVQANTPPVPSSNVQDAVTGAAKELTSQMKDVTKMFMVAPNQPKVTMEEKLFGGLSYIPLAPIATLVIKGDSNFVKLHGRQSFVITGLFFACIFFYLVPLIGLLFAGIVQFGLLIIGIFSMYQAFIGNWWKIPVLGDIAEVIPVGLFVSITKEVLTGQAQPQNNITEPQKAIIPPETTQSAPAPTEPTNQQSSTPGTTS